MERHDLLHEFPEYKEKMDTLLANDTHFKELFDEYSRTEEEVYKINSDEVHTIDEYAHTLKAKLLHLKDEIYSLLRK